MVFKRSRKKPQPQPLDSLNLLLTQLAKAGTAEERIAAALESLRRGLTLRRLELFLYEPSGGLAYLVAATPAAAETPRLADPQSRPELFAAVKTRPALKSAILTFPLYKDGTALGVLAAHPGQATAVGVRLLQGVLPAAAALLAPVLQATDLHRVFYQALPVFRETGEEQRREILRLLAGSFSHILNQPLTALIGYLELSRKQENWTAEQSSYLLKAADEARRLSELLQAMERLDQAAVERYVGEAQILSWPRGEGPARAGRDGESVAAPLALFFELVTMFSKRRSSEQILESFARLLSRRRGLRQLCYFAAPAGGDAPSPPPTYSFGPGQPPGAAWERLKEVASAAGREIGLFYLPSAEKGGRALLAPLSMQGVPLGVLFLDFAAPSGETWGPAEEKILLALCGQLALSLLEQRLLSETRYWKEYLQDLLQSANALIFAIDGEQRISVFNRAMESTFGYRQPEVLGKPVNLLFPEERALAAFAEACRRAAAGQEVRNLELSLQTRDGQVLPAVFNLTAVADLQHAGVGLIAVGQDLSEVRSLEQQVIQSEKLAYFGQMSASFVHELNNPLTSISVYADYLLRRVQAGGGDPEMAEKLQKILAGAERIQSFTQNLTSFARPANRESLEELDLREVLHQAVSFTEHETKQAGIEISLELADPLPPIWAVRSQLQQVFVNLIVNARQAIPGRGRIAIGATPHQGDQLRVTVEDNGVGIEPMFLGKIFDPFFSTKARGEGTGLGLSIVKRIVDNHLGSIRVTSVKGRGTCFTLFLPRTALRDKLAGGTSRARGRTDESPHREVE